MRNAQYAGLVGMILIHSSAIPGIYSALTGGPIPPALMIAQNCLALTLLTFHAFRFRIWLYLAGNLFGLIGQIVLLCLILTR